MKGYDVVCVMGRNTYIMREVEARTDIEAKSVMWNRFLDEKQRENVEDVWVFPVKIGGNSC